MTHTEYLARFEALTARMLAITRAKNTDYAGGDTKNALRNFGIIEAVSDNEISAEKGVMVRLTDKLTRAYNLLGQEAAVADESLEDTLVDLANYALILAVLVADRRRTAAVPPPVPLYMTVAANAAGNAVAASRPTGDLFPQEVTEPAAAPSAFQTLTNLLRRAA